MQWVRVVEEHFMQKKQQVLGEEARMFEELRNHQRKGEG